MVNQDRNYYVKAIMLIFLIVFTAFVCIQIVRKLVGGSWNTETVILTIVTINAGATYLLFIELGNTKADFHKSLARLEINLSKEIYKLREDLKSDIHKLDNRMKRLEPKSGQ